MTLDRSSLLANPAFREFLDTVARLLMRTIRNEHTGPGRRPPNLGYARADATSVPALIAGHLRAVLVKAAAADLDRRPNPPVPTGRSPVRVCHCDRLGAFPRLARGLFEARHPVGNAGY